MPLDPLRPGCIPRLLCVATALLVAGVVGSRALAEPPLVVGMELAYPPFEMTDPQGEPVGVSVDLAEALAMYLGRELRIRNTPFSGLIPSLKTGRIDLILSSMTATDERQRSIDFSTPYVRTGLAILARRDVNVTGIEDLAGPERTIAVKLGTTGHEYARRALSMARILVLKKESACVMEVVQGKADAFLYDQLSVYQHWRRNPDTTRPVLEPFQVESWAIGIRKGNHALREQVNRFLNAFREDGGFERLGDKHLADMKAAFRQLGYPFVF